MVASGSFDIARKYGVEQRSYGNGDDEDDDGDEEEEEEERQGKMQWSEGGEERERKRAMVLLREIQEEEERVRMGHSHVYSHHLHEQHYHYYYSQASPSLSQSQILSEGMAQESPPQGSVVEGPAATDFHDREKRQALIRAGMFRRETELLEIEFEEKSNQLRNMQAQQQQQRQQQQAAGSVVPRNSEMSENIIKLEAEVNGLERALQRMEYLKGDYEATLGGREQTDQILQAAREKREDQTVRSLRRRMAQEENEMTRTMQMEQQSLQKSIETARKGVLAARRRLKEENVIITKEADEVRKVQQKMKEDRVAALLQLKSSVAVISDKMKEKVEKEERRRRETQAERDAEFQKILAEGGNPYEVLRFREEQKKLEQRLRKMAERQKAREVEISERIQKELKLDHQERIHHRHEVALSRKYVEELGPEKQAEKVAAFVASRTRDGRSIVDPTGRMARVDGSKVTSIPDWSFGVGTKLALEDILKKMSAKHPTVGFDEKHASLPQLDATVNPAVTRKRPSSSSKPESAAAGGGFAVIDPVEDDLVILKSQTFAQPEFAGAWSDYSSETPSTGSGPEKTRHLSKLEQQYMATAKIRQRENIVQKQVVWGKEFKGQAFLPDPSAVIFADFDVGQTYVSKFTLTNVSNGFSSFKVLDIEDAFRDFFDISLQLPGQMSAGTSCTLTVRFSPKLNQDIDTVIPFLGQTGPFSVPLRASTKKCVISSVPESGSSVDFGPTVLAETATKTVIIKNAGALISEFSCVVDGTDQVVVTPSAGFAEAFSSLALTLTYIPRILGELSSTLTVRFKREEVGSLAFPILGCGKEVPIFVDREVIDFRSCRSSVLYRDKIYIHNRGTAAMKVGLTRRRDSPHSSLIGLEFVPPMGFVQAGSFLEVQVKMDPSLREPYSEQDMDYKETIDLQIPGQTMPVSVAVSAMITSSSVRLLESQSSLPSSSGADPFFVNFGKISTQFCSRKHFVVKNFGSLPRKIGFRGKLGTDVLFVEPEGGFATLLPREAKPFTINWSPRYSALYDARSSNLVLELKCEDDPSFSQCIVGLGEAYEAPVVADSSSIRLRAVPRGDSAKEQIILTNTGSERYVCEWEHQVANLSVFPRVVELKPGQSLPVTFVYSPPLSFQMQLSVLPSKDTVCRCHVSPVPSSPDAAVDPATRFLIPIEFHAAVIDNVLSVVEGDVLDFGVSAVHSRVCKTVTLKLAGGSSLQSSLKVLKALDPNGSFVLNSQLPQKLDCNERYTLSLDFCPAYPGSFHCDFVIGHDDCNSVRLQLKGTGVEPKVAFSPFPLVECGDLVYVSPSQGAPAAPSAKGAAVVDASVLAATANVKEVVVKVTTQSPFPVELVSRVRPFSGESSAFRVLPETQIVPANGTAEFKIMFAPVLRARAGVPAPALRFGLYSAALDIFASGHSVPSTLYLHGNLFKDAVQPYHPVTLERLQAREKRAVGLLPADDGHAVVDTLLVEFPPGTNVMKVKLFTAAEFTVECSHKAFKVDPLKGPGASNQEAKDLTITFSPNAQDELQALAVAGCSNISVTVETKVKISVKGLRDVFLLLRGQVRADQ